MWSERWSAGLRQGDVVGPILFPLLPASFTTVARPSSIVTDNDDAVPSESILMPVKPTLAVIISHDCEFNENKRNKLLVAGTEGIQKNLTPEQRAALRASNDVYARSKAGEAVHGVHSFVLAALPGYFEDEVAVVFTTITPLPMKMAADLRAVKRGEMEHDQRVLFRYKLARYFGRDADDVPDEEKEDAPPPPASPTEGVA